MNRSRFRFIPYITDVKKNLFTVKFHGLGNIVFLKVQKGHEFSMWTNLVSQRINYPWDWVADFDLLEQKSSRGYSCGLCEGDYKKYYLNRKDMYIEHCYEPFLEWCNEKLVVGHYVLNMGKIDHGGCSRFCTKSDLETIHKNELIDVFEIKPVKKGRGKNVN
jgi:hypothetical protein